MSSRAIRNTLLIVTLSVLAWFWHQRSTRNHATSSAIEFATALGSRDTATLRRLVTTPPFLTEKAPAERDSLIVDLLKTEISSEGMCILTQNGDFGPLRKEFPTEADSWAKAFSVNPDDCVAFRLKRGDLTAELVLHRQSDSTYRVLRCNDIRQLAQSSPP